jgi:Fe2+ or Zn2+ uptake regulation protein
MAVQSHTVLRIAADIRRYLERHPNAADSVEGVTRWWLTREGSEESIVNVQQALDLLVEGGTVTKRVQQDGQTIYVRARKSSSNAWRARDRSKPKTVEGD